jgi:hypothetical protein
MLTLLDSGGSQLIYTNREVSELINLLPPVSQRLTAAGRFRPRGGTSAFVEIERLETSLRMIPAVADGRPANRQARKPGESLIFKIPNMPVITTITANAIRNIRAAGQRGARTMADEVNRELTTMRMQFDLTREYLRMTALKGIIKDGAGSTLYDLYEAFGITKKTVDFALDVPTTNVRAKCQEIVAHVGANLRGDTFTQIQVEVSTDFFDDLIAHPNVEKFYVNAEQALNIADVLRGVDANYRPREFPFGGVRFVEVPGQVELWNGTTAPFIEPGFGHAYPGGTLMTEEAFVAPPIDITEMTGVPANVADVLHVTQEILKHNAGVELQGQLNELPLYKRPQVLVEVTK